MNQYLIEYDMYLNGGYIGNDISRIYAEDGRCAIVKLREMLPEFSRVTIRRVLELTFGNN